MPNDEKVTGKRLFAGTGNLLVETYTGCSLLGQGTYLLRHIQGVPEYLYFFLIQSNLYPSPTVITAKDIQSSLRNKSVQPAPIGWSH